MIKLTGKTACRGTAMGKIRVLTGTSMPVEAVVIQDTEAEAARVRDAIKAGQDQLAALYDRAMEEVGEEGAAIFEVHQMLMEDEAFTDAIYDKIRSGRLNAEYAVFSTGEEFAGIFSEMEDEYFRARSTDIRDIAARLVRILSGEENESDCSGPADSSGEAVIYVAEDLTPGETVAMEQSGILGFATAGGSVNSHTAILARMRSIPAVTGLPMKLKELKSGMTAILYGDTGTVIFDPSEEECAKARQQIREEAEQKELLEALKGKEDVSRSGRKLNIYANISSAGDAELVLAVDAAGVGLFRSEFLYLGRDSFPTEEEQFEAYRSAAEKLDPRPVIIRTLDIGADKKADYFHLDREENPALGCRAIRICLTRPEIFRTQLRALLRASVYGNLKIMYPMITSVREVKQIHEIVKETAAELEKEGVGYRIPQQGIMIETPAAVIIADDLAKEADFFSIGTNDLIQYTLALDRQGSNLDAFYDPHHPAILRMLKMVTDAAHANAIPAGICGDLGADPELTEYYLSIGLDEISVPPASVLKLRKIVRNLD